MCCCPTALDWVSSSMRTPWSAIGFADRGTACHSFKAAKTRDIQGDSRMLKTTRRTIVASAALVALGLATEAAAQEAVKIGVIYPLSGNSASAGNYSKMAIEVGADVINNGNAELAKILPLAKGGGLPGLKGAKIQLIFADNQGTPAAGQKEQKAAGQKVGSIAVVHENTEYGNSVASVIVDQFAKDSLPVTQKIAYSANSSDVQPQVLQLKEKNPDVVIFISYTSDAILYTKMMKELGWKPAIMIADNAGFNDPAFVKSMSPLVEGLVNRSTFAGGKPGSVPALFNELYKKKTGGDDLDDVSARGLQGFLVMADAINRAGSTDPAKIRDALKATNLPADQMVTGYDGVKFDDKGQNILASSLVTQMRGGKYVAIWPKARATDQVVLPYKGW